jgi:hypothetical protein
MRWKVALAAVLATGALTVLPQTWAAATSTANAAGTVGIRLVPLPGAGDRLASSYIVDRLAPGATMTRIVQVDNDTDHFAVLSLYVAAASVVRGDFVFAPGRTANQLSGWTSTSRGLIGLQPHSEAYATVTTKVPSRAAAGDDQAVVWVAMTASPASGQGITLISRAGVRMYVTVGPGGGAPSNFVLGKLVASRRASGASVVSATVRNTGGNTLDLVGALTLTKGPGGLSAGPFDAKLGVLLSPGSVESVSVTLASRFPRGPWRADLKVSGGYLSRSTSSPITFPPRYVTEGGARYSVLPLSLLLVLLSALWISVIAFIVLRRQRLLRVVVRH